MSTNEFGLKIGQPIRRNLQLGKRENSKFVAYANIPMPDNTFDGRVILISNDYELDENSVGKYCTMQIIGRCSHYYIAEADVSGISEFPDLIRIYVKLNLLGELTFEIGVDGVGFRIPIDFELLVSETGVTYEQFENLYVLLKNKAQKYKEHSAEMLLIF